MVPEVPGVSTPQYLILFCYPQLLHSCTITEPIATSDHLSVLVQLSSSNRPPKVKPTRRKMWIHKAANTELALDLFSSLFKQSCVNESWSVCKSKFWSVIHATIPSKTVPIRGNLPWLSREISRRFMNAIFFSGNQKGHTTLTISSDIAQLEIRLCT